MTFRTVTYVVTPESTQNEIYLLYYEITCNLFFYCRISLTIFLHIKFCSENSTELHIYWKLCYSTCNIACLNTTKDIANSNDVSYMKMYYYVISFALSIPMARLNSIT